MNKLVKSIEIGDLTSEFLTAANGILQLTPRELELMTELVNLDINYVKVPGKNKNIANRDNRKHIINKLGITRDNLSRYIKAFKQKGILVRGPAEDELQVRRALIPIVIGDRVQLTLILKLLNERKINDNDGISGNDSNLEGLQ